MTQLRLPPAMPAWSKQSAWVWKTNMSRVAIRLARPCSTLLKSSSFPGHTSRFRTSPCKANVANYVANLNWHYCFRLWVALEHDYKELVEEYQLFDFNAIVASVGGSLGLFLGFSFLDCIWSLYTRGYQLVSHLQSRESRDKLEASIGSLGQRLASFRSVNDVKPLFKDSPVK